MKKIIALLYVTAAFAHGPTLPPDPWVGSGNCVCCSTCGGNPQDGCQFRPTALRAMMMKCHMMSNNAEPIPRCKRRKM